MQSFSEGTVFLTIRDIRVINKKKGYREKIWKKKRELFVFVFVFVRRSVISSRS